MIDWRQIDTVLLDMDGTLLDLHFDNYFWMEYLPQRYAEIKSVDSAYAYRIIQQQTHSIRGTLEWYSTDYWSETLGIDVVELKREVSHKVATRPYCVDFLNALRAADKDVVMVTNAHHDSLNLKMEKTGIAHAGRFPAHQQRSTLCGPLPRIGHSAHPIRFPNNAVARRWRMQALSCGVLRHDRWQPCYTCDQCDHARCNAHQSRQFKRAFEQDDQQWPIPGDCWNTCVNVKMMCSVS